MKVFVNHSVLAMVSGAALLGALAWPNCAVADDEALPLFLTASMSLEHDSNFSRTPKANSETVVIVQAEHATAVENIESIVKIPGIDAIQLGPYDLSASMGKMGEINDPEVVAAIDRVISVSRSANLPVGCFGVTPKAVRADIERGCTLVCSGVDTIFLGQAANQMLSAVKGEN